MTGVTDITLGLGMAKAGKLLAATKIGQKVIQKADDAMTAVSNKFSRGVAKAADVEQAVKNKFKKSVSTAADLDFTDLNKVKNPFSNNIGLDLPGTGSLDNLGIKTAGDMLEMGSSPYDLLKERGIPATLSDPEISASNAFDLRMQGPEVNNGLGKTTRRQDFRDAKESAGIPKSAQPDTHAYVYDGTSENRTVYEFTVDRQKKYVILHSEDKMGRGPHFHGADGTKGNPFDNGRYNQYPGHFPDDFDGF